MKMCIRDRISYNNQLSSLPYDDDGVQKKKLDLAGNATLLYYMSEEAKEGKNAFVEKRAPDFSKLPRLP